MPLGHIGCQVCLAEPEKGRLLHPQYQKLARQYCSIVKRVFARSKQEKGLICLTYHRGIDNTTFPSLLANIAGQRAGDLALGYFSTPGKARLVWTRRVWPTRNVNPASQMLTS